MKKSALSFAIICFPALLIFSQDNKWGVSLTPALVPAVSLQPALQIGMENRIATRWHLLTELALPLKKDPPELAANVHYFRIKPEVRYSLTNNEYGAQWYTGLQISYVVRNWEDPNEGNYFEEGLYDDSCITYSSASIRSPIFTSSAQVGTLLNIGEHFSFDIFLGMGVRVISTIYSDVSNPGKDFSIRPKCQIMFSPDPAHWVNGRITRFHFNTGLRFLYRF